MRYYPQFSKEFVENELWLMQGFAYLADAIEHDGWLNFVGVTRVGKGYIAMEIEDLMSQAEYLWNVPTKE